MEYLLIALVSYVLGSIPFGFILTKIFLKKDIRNIGSGNIGLDVKAIVNQIAQALRHFHEEGKIIHAVSLLYRL